MHLTAICSSVSCTRNQTRKLIRVMKITAMILLTACLTAGANGNAQKVTFSGKNVPLETVFNAIKKQTGYVVFYEYTIIAEANKVTVNVKNVPVEKLLDECFREQPLTYSIEGKTILVTRKEIKTLPIDLPPPPIDVKGRIVNENGEPVRATVTVKGTRNAVSTNDNGEFIIKGVDANATLVVTGVSTETIEVKVSCKTDLATISTKTKVKEGEEVIIKANTGYEEIAPNKTTGSYTVITNEMLNKQTGTNIIDRLNGVTNGMLFNIGKRGADNKTNPYSIRGLSTINASIEPLIVLDNFPFDGNINNINPNDVESVTILKDAAATSIYGARGGNGVIVITSKKGRFNQKLRVGFNSTLLVTEEPDLYYLPRISTTDYIDVEQYLYSQGFFLSSTSSDYQPITPLVEILQKRKNGQISTADSASQIDALRKIDSRDELRKYFYSPAVSKQHSLNLTGGSGNITWLASASYDENTSNLDAKTNRLNIRINNTYKPLKNLELSFGAYYTNSKTRSGKSAVAPFRQAPYTIFSDANGTPLPIVSAVGAFRLSYTDTVGGGQLLDWKNYPLDDYKHDVTSSINEQIIATIGLKYQFIQGLAVDLSYQYQNSWSETEKFSDINSYYARSMINNFTNLNYTAANSNLRNPIPIGDILRSTNNKSSSQNARVQFNFKRSLGRHFISAIAGGEIREVLGSGNSHTLYGYQSNPLTFQRIDFWNRFPNYRTGALNLIPGSLELFANTVTRSISIFANGSYTFNERYTVTSSLRRDASNIFGLSTNDKWNPLWSIGAGWDISKESFFRIKMLPVLRLRATWGYSGNVDNSKTGQITLVYPSSTPNPAGYPYASILQPPNRLLKWEKVRQVNIGLDFALKKNSISGSIEFYQKKGIDLYGLSLFDYTNYPFAQSITRNVANMMGKGIDIQIRVVNLDKGVKWTTSYIFNFNQSKVTKYWYIDSFDGSEMKLVLGDGNSIIPIVGKPLYAIAAYKWGGLDASGNPQGYLNGQLSTDYFAIRTSAGTKSPIVYKGSTVPVVFGAVTNDLSWRSLFDFSQYCL